MIIYASWNPLTYVSVYISKSINKFSPVLNLTCTQVENIFRGLIKPHSEAIAYDLKLKDVKRRTSRYISTVA